MAHHAGASAGRRRCGSPRSWLVISARSAGACGARAGGEAGEGVAEVAARVVAADVRRVEPAVDDTSPTWR